MLRRLVEKSLGIPSAISVKTFQTPLPENKVEQFKYTHVNRECWMSWLILSFQLSEGSPTKQMAFGAWCRFNLNFDDQKTVDNFLQAQEEIAYSLLNPIEILMFTNNFKSVPDHRQRVNAYQQSQESQVDSILQALKLQLWGLRLSEDLDPNEVKMIARWSKKDLTHKLRTYVRIETDS